MRLQRQTIPATVLIVGMSPGVCAQAPQPSAAWTVEVVKENVERPWSLNFAPDGRLFFTSRNTGTINVMNTGTGQVTVLEGAPATRIVGESGFMGLALDPQFASNQQLYLCYSYWKDGKATADGTPLNRVSRFTIDGQRLVNEKVLVDALPGYHWHNGCRILPGPGGHLFITAGDAAQDAAAQDLTFLGGKVLRINRDGSIPADNPFPGSPVWTLGHRNAQGLAFDPASGKLWSTEHGPDVKDELNIIKRGRNYGWPLCMGTDPCNVENYEPAVRHYTDTWTIAPSDMVFYDANAFPDWKGNLFFVTLRSGRLYRLTLEGEAVRDEQILIDNTYGRLRDIAVGPDGALYLSTDNKEESRILRLRPK